MSDLSDYQRMVVRPMEERHRSTVAELRARAEKAEARVAQYDADMEQGDWRQLRATRYRELSDASAERDRLRAGIQALADEATWLDFQEFFDRESPWYDPHEGLARVARDLLNPTPEGRSE